MELPASREFGWSCAWRRRATVEQIGGCRWIGVQRCCQARKGLGGAIRFRQRNIARPSEVITVGERMISRFGIVRSSGAVVFMVMFVDESEVLEE